jgi:hypothetical protein
MNLDNSHLYIRLVPKISVANYQKSNDPSNLSRVYSLFTTNNNCDGTPAQTEHYYYSGNPLLCMTPSGPGPILSAQVVPDGDSSGYRWNMQFFSDTGCKDQIDEMDTNDGAQCLGEGLMPGINSVYAWIP